MREITQKFLGADEMLVNKVNGCIVGIYKRDCSINSCKKQSIILFLFWDSWEYKAPLAVYINVCNQYIKCMHLL